jgi:AraC-like DNA-binding protein
MKDTYIPIAQFDRLIAEAKASGCNVDALLDEVGIGLEAIHQRKDVPAKKYGHFYRLVMLETQNEWFGMFAGGKVPLGAFRMMAFSLLQCQNLRQAVYRAGEFAEICRGMHVKFMLEIVHGRAHLSVSPIRSLAAADFQALLEQTSVDAILTSMLTWHRLAEWLCDHDIPLQSIGVSFAKTGEELPLAYGNFKQVLYSQAVNSIVFDEKYLDLPVVQNQHSLNDFLSSAPYHLVTQDPAHISPADKVRSIIKREIGDSMPSADSVASTLNVSVTTLRRQLQREQTSFQKIKDECRMEAAFHYLNCDDLSNADIADKLGFDEPSAFFRSFKKWTGMTPGEYRSHDQSS